ncbi:MAG TPA: ATP-binding cassette domain-containing protein [Acidimicrobiales bacterium]|nr:ATP-binding cassette domain-containing protein [Acidimicrobiales bacterium]
MTTAALGADRPDPGPAGDVVLRTDGIAKHFGPVVALRGVDMHLRRGEVLGLVGDNGAGKSTLVKILCGYQRPDVGKMYVEGRQVHFRSVGDARAMGIETVYQDLALVPQLPVYKNLFLKREVVAGGRLGFLSDGKMRKLARQYLDDIKVNVPSVDAPVERLSGGQRQAIAVARATRSDVKILLLDEPLSAMGAKESALIIDLVRDLSKNRGVSIIVIDHNYAHIFELCDRINVIHQGVVSFDKRVEDTSLEELTNYMVSEYRQQIMSGRGARQTG